MPKLSGMLNNCGLHAAIPSVLTHLQTLATKADLQVPHYPAYLELKRAFCSYYGLNDDDTSFQKLYNFLNSKTFIEQQLILGPVLRNFLVNQLRNDVDNLNPPRSDNVTEIGELGKGKEYTQFDNFLLVFDKEDDKRGLRYVSPGRFISLSLHTISGYLFKLLGIKLNHVFEKVEGKYVERQGFASDVVSPVKTIDIYQSNDHFELVKSPPEEEQIKGKLDYFVNKLEAAEFNSEKLTAQEINANVQGVLDQLKTAVRTSYQQSLQEAQALSPEAGGKVLSAINLRRDEMSQAKSSIEQAKQEFEQAFAK